MLKASLCNLKNTFVIKTMLSPEFSCKTNFAQSGDNSNFVELKMNKLRPRMSDHNFKNKLMKVRK